MSHGSDILFYTSDYFYYIYSVIESEHRLETLQTETSSRVMRSSASHCPLAMTPHHSPTIPSPETQGITATDCWARDRSRRRTSNPWEDKRRALAVAASP
jgi:hypothetical protein